MFRRPYRPEDNVRDFTISKNDPDLRKTNWNLLDFPDLARERSRRKLLRTESQLEKKRKHYQLMREKMNKQWAEIRAEGLALQQNFINFNEFLMVNLSKRQRAKVNILEEKKFREKTEASIADVIVKIERLKKIRVEFDQEIRAHKIYEIYLSKVVERCSKEEGIRNENSLVERFEYYVELSRQLAQQSEEIFSKLQKAKTEMNKFIEAGNQILIGLRTKAATLESTYDEVSRRVRNLEYWIYKIRTNIHRQNEDCNLVKEATWNLFLLISRRKNLREKVKKEDLEKQFIHIKHTLKQMRSINEKLAPTKTKSKHKKIETWK